MIKDIIIGGLELTRVGILYILKGLIVILSKGAMTTLDVTAKGAIMVGKRTTTRKG